ncbi:uncharacterized protein BO72DRAFT_445291 [Aspergillus fijiensis CBS 313.89]|uniref:Uncharacterized protein n=1 Tax=Aspergillus fijiensis CBS 313.89 TaxID=1448319 RepID=A0A8G1RXJ5_9EURO|nr:uncharacterized protein BO72DRAFT_445291 [Aspergillus fijiensis CBS 313.89]RAK80714.1 hypothetical protein BO72DRAFT_445291 [Aspergillus fijiensis CBS 313.89]
MAPDLRNVSTLNSTLQPWGAETGVYPNTASLMACLANGLGFSPPPQLPPRRPDPG